MKKLLYLNNFEPPYRVPFFNLLGERYDMTLALSETTTDRTERNMAWFTEHERSYQVKQLSCRSILGRPVATQVKEMLGDYDLVFMDMYGNWTNMYAIWRMALSGRKFMLSVDGLLPHDRENLFSRSIKHFLLNCPVHVLSSGSASDEVLKSYGVPPEKISRYHFTPLTKKDLADAAEWKKLDRQALRAQLGMAEKRILLSVGRFSYDRGYGKGYDLLMRAAEGMDSSIGIYIVGDEPTEEFVRWKEEKKLDHVHFTGFKSKEELAEYYAAADAFVLMTRGDVWGLVINEAMAYGLPVITTDRCMAGLELIDEDVNGYIVHSGDACGLSDKIRRLFSEEGKAERMGAAAQKRIQPWNIENMAQEHFQAFDEFLS